MRVGNVICLFTKNMTMLILVMIRLFDKIVRIVRALVNAVC